MKSNSPLLGRHSLFDDAQAIVTATLLIALGLVFYQRAGLLAGGTVGISFLIHYATAWNFGLVLFAVNLPFYVLAWRVMGARFTLKTFSAVALLSIFSEGLPRLVTISAVEPVFAAVMGGFLIGVGLLILFRHRASLGGLGVIVLWLQKNRGWPAGRVQMAFDVSIVAAAFAVVSPWRVAVSVLGAVALNFIIAVNHKPGRYLGT
ncbi:MAG: YitT family protein [Burkholderiaceae bacterium]